MTFQLSVSLAPAPLINIKEILNTLDSLSVEMIHFDIEDGLFVPTMTFGTKIIGDLRPHSTRIFDVHLMVLHPEKIIRDVIKMGANRISVHVEACSCPYHTLSMIKEYGAVAGLAFNPMTQIPDLDHLLPVLDFVNVLSTDPYELDGKFIPSTLCKIGNKHKGKDPIIEWEMDGGLNPYYSKLALENDFDTLVVGRYLFEGGSISENIRTLRESNLN